MRAYFFGNFYLSSIQQGIQAAHCVTEMFVKYKRHKQERDPLLDWARNHKTIILLNGGDCFDLLDIYCMINDESNPYPWSKFHESVTALNDAITCVGIILPEKIYESAETLREKGVILGADLTKWELDMIRCLNSCGLAK